MTKSKHLLVLPAGAVVKILGFHPLDAFWRPEGKEQSKIIGQVCTLTHGLKKTSNPAIRGPYYVGSVDSLYFYAIKLKIISIPELLSPAPELSSEPEQKES